MNPPVLKKINRGSCENDALRTRNVSKRNNKSTERPSPDIHVLGLEGPYVRPIEPGGEEQRAKKQNLMRYLDQKRAANRNTFYIARADDFPPFGKGLYPASFAERDFDSILALDFLGVGK